MTDGATAEAVKEEVKVADAPVVEEDDRLTPEMANKAQFTELKEFVFEVVEEKVKQDGAREWVITATPNGWAGKVEKFTYKFTAEEAKMNRASKGMFKDRVNDMLQAAVAGFRAKRQSAVGHQLVYGG